MEEDRQCVTSSPVLLTRFDKSKILKHNYGDIEKSIAQVTWQSDFYSMSSHPVSVSRRENLEIILEELQQERSHHA
jgi:hypothetical protein